MSDLDDWEDDDLRDDGVIEPSGQVDRWRRRSVAGGVLTGFALGLQEVLYPKQKEEMAIVVEAGEPGRQPLDRRLELRVQVDERAQLVRQPGDRHLVLASTCEQLLDPAIGEVHRPA